MENYELNSEDLEKLEKNLDEALRKNAVTGFMEKDVDGFEDGIVKIPILEFKDSIIHITQKTHELLKRDIHITLENLNKEYIQYTIQYIIKYGVDKIVNSYAKEIDAYRISKLVSFAEKYASTNCEYGYTPNKDTICEKILNSISILRKKYQGIIYILMNYETTNVLSLATGYIDYRNIEYITCDSLYTKEDNNKSINFMLIPASTPLAFAKHKVKYIPYEKNLYRSANELILDLQHELIVNPVNPDKENMIYMNVKDNA